MLKKYITIFTLCSALFSCGYLDFDETIEKDKNYVYAYFDQLEGLVSFVYEQLPADFGVLDGALRESATDNAVYTWSNNQVYNFYYDAWSPINTIDNAWSHTYTAIRSANSFLENFTLEDFERFQYNDDYDVWLKKVETYTAEVRFLRAFYHFELAKRYGDIPLMTRTYSMKEVNSVGKTKFEDVIRFIVAECDAIENQLPITYNMPGMSGETGRVTWGAAKALKSRALLYAASTLHNRTNDADKWEAAAKSAYDIIKSRHYSLPLISSDPLYSYNGGNEVLASPQLIFERRQGNSSTFERHNLPVGFEEGNSGNTPTQNLADAYEMLNGNSFDWNNAAHRNYPYFDASGKPVRDPRFYINIVPNGAALAKTVVETFDGGKHGYPIAGTTMTGYYLKKYINETVSLSPSSPVQKPHHFAIYRYAETLLNYAEAMNEWKGPDYTDGDLELSARDALNQVRTSAGMLGVASMIQEQLRKRIRNERRVELAFEDHRFWDVRRWMIGGETTEIYGVKIVKNGSDFEYTRQLVQQRIWDDKMCLYPIPQSEIYKNKYLLPQNQGWN